MALDTEAIWASLFDRLSLAEGFTTKTRRPRRYGLEEYPVLELWDNGAESLLSDSDDPGPIWKLTGEIAILCHNPDKDADPITGELNSLVKAIRDVLEQKTADPIYGRTQYYWRPNESVRVLSISSVEKGMAAETGFPAAKLTVEMETNAL